MIPVLKWSNSFDNLFLGKPYDMTTVGGFTAYARDYKKGGVKRLLQQLKPGQMMEEGGKESVVQRVCRWTHLLLVTVSSMTVN